MLACLLLWFSVCCHIWLQNATNFLFILFPLLTQLGPMAWLGYRTWGIPSLLLVSLFVDLILVIILVWHILKGTPRGAHPSAPRGQAPDVSHQPSFIYSEWTEDKLEDDFQNLD